MRWSKEDIDALYNGIDEGQEFSFDPVYFEDIEKQLPVLRRRTSVFGFWLNVFLVFLSSVGSIAVSRAPENVTRSTYTTQRDADEQVAPDPSEKSNILSAERSPNTENNASEFIQGIAMFEEPSEVVQSEYRMDVYPVLPVKPLSIEELNDSEPLIFSLNRSISKQRQHWYATFNSGLQQSWTNVGNHARANVSVGAEAGWSVRVGRQLTASAGISFHWTSFDQLEIKERTKIYGFGYATYDNSYSFTGMASMGIPLSLTMRSNRHSFGPLLEYRRNLFAQIKRVQSWNDEVFQTSKGVTDLALLNRHSLQLGARYEFALNESLSIGADVRYELAPQITSDRFEGKVNSHPLSANVSIKAYFGK